MNVVPLLRAVCRASSPLIVLCAVWSFGAHAAPRSPAQTHAASASAAPSIAPSDQAPVSTTGASAAPISLATLDNLSGPLRLAGQRVSTSISLPLSARERVESATLHLVVTNSVSLLSDRSQLAVRVNGTTIAQLALSSKQPETTADIRIPPELLRPGYNTLGFVAAQHSTENCEDPNAPELWTEVDTSASTLRMQTTLAPLATPRLSDLDDLIDPKAWSTHAFAIVNAAHPANDTQLATGSLIAQGIALRLRYLSAPPRVTDAQRGAGSGIAPGLALGKPDNADVFVVGTRDQLRPYLDPQVLSRVSGAFLGLYPKPDDPHRFMLVVTGRDDAEVERAARVFAHRELPLPRRGELAVDALDEAAVAPWSTSRVLAGTAPRTFRSLDFRSRTLAPGDRAEMRIALPADVYAPEDAQVSLDLNFTAGAKMRSDSVLNLYLNDRFEQVIALDHSEGGVIRHYRVSIPLRSFRAGENTLSLRPVLVPSVSDRCTFLQTENLRLTIFEDSTIKLPPASHFTTLPDLGRFAESGFPYTAHPDGSDLALTVAGRDNETIGAAWALAGKLAQAAGEPLSRAQITFGVAAPARQAMLVGAAPTLPKQSLDGAPWAPGHSERVADSIVPGETQAASWLPWGLGSRAEAAPQASGEVLLRGALPLAGQLLVMQYRDTSGRAMTVFTAASTADLAQGVGRLIEPGLWSGLDGDVSLLDVSRGQWWTARVGSTFEFGSTGLWDHLGFLVSSHPWFGYAALVALLAALAATTTLLLRRQHLKRHREARK
jgi:hypothetical protein